VEKGVARAAARNAALRSALAGTLLRSSALWAEFSRGRRSAYAGIRPCRIRGGVACVKKWKLNGETADARRQELKAPRSELNRAAKDRVRYPGSLEQFRTFMAQFPKRPSLTRPRRHCMVSAVPSGRRRLTRPAASVACSTSHDGGHRDQTTAAETTGE